MKSIILQQAKYNVWANNKTLQLISSLDNGLPEKEIKGSYASIKHILFHIWDAEFIWLQRLNGKSLTTFPSKEAGAVFSAEGMLNTSNALLDYAESKSVSQLAENIQYKNLKGDLFETPVSGILMHVFNHGTFHRGQVISTLRAQGYEGKIDSTDLITFLREQSV